MLAMSDITITLPDGSERSLPEGATGTTLAESIGPGLAKAALVVDVDGQPHDLAAPLPDHAAVKFVTDRDPEALEHLRHSTAHVLAQAVLDLYPGSTFAIGPGSTVDDETQQEESHEHTSGDQQQALIGWH